VATSGGRAEETAGVSAAAGCSGGSVRARRPIETHTVNVDPAPSVLATRTRP